MRIRLKMIIGRNQNEILRTVKKIEARMSKFSERRQGQSQLRNWI